MTHTPKPTFEAIVTTYGPTVWRVCRAVVGAADAPDAWSNTFLSALRAFPDLPADANVEAWLVTIAHRKAIDVVRASARRAVPMADLPEPARRSHHAPLHDAPLHDVLLHDSELLVGLARLPARQRQAVAYHYIADLPYAEVAAILGGTTDAARRAAADGIATLRRTYPHAPTKKGPRQ